jgi:hypothetical protein
MQTPSSELAAFMSGYVALVNQATLDVRIRAVRIGGARYSRLAQINLQSRIITFSRYAVENVPERGLRYLVIHELSHVLEPTHNRRFWDIVARFEPDFKRVDKEIEEAFKRNVRAVELSERGASSAAHRYLLDDLSADNGYGSHIADDESGAWSDLGQGIICGGSF